MVEGVIFDMDGLMFDSERVWMTLWKPTLAQFGMEVPAGLPDAARGSAGVNMLRILRQYCGEDCDAPAIFQELQHQGYLAFLNGIPKKPGLDELLAWLQEQHIPCAVASSSIRPTVLHNLETGHVSEYFSAVISGEQVQHGKPEPDIFLKAAEELGVQPAHCLVLEDSHNGVRAGAAGGFITVMVPDLAPANEEMQQLYTACCRDLNEVRELLAEGKLG